jgi:hypothetical protein
MKEEDLVNYLEEGEEELLKSKLRDDLLLHLHKTRVFVLGLVFEESEGLSITTSHSINPHLHSFL